jgi:hypothetical protein
VFRGCGAFEVFWAEGCFETKGGLQGINGFLAETKNTEKQRLFHGIHIFLLFPAIY